MKIKFEYCDGWDNTKKKLKSYISIAVPFKKWKKKIFSVRLQTKWL